MLLKTLKQEQRKIAELEARLKTISPEERGVGGEEMEERKEERVKEEEGTETGGQESGERQLAESRKAWKSGRRLQIPSPHQLPSLSVCLSV